MNVNGTTTNFTYDAWGRMSGKTQGSYAATYGYRFGDKLKAVTSSFPGEAASVGYNYDGLGKRRVEQLGTSSITWFRWLGMEESGEYTGTPGTWTIGAMQTGYVPGLATFAGANPTTAEWRYPLTDHLRSVRQLTAQNKAALARYDYAPYGELMRSAGLPLAVGYTGHRWDPEIGQYFAPFRYYNPQTARWNMRDPVGFVDGLNMYAYVAGSPTNSIDPDGLFIDTVFDAAMLGYDVFCGNFSDAAWDGLALLIPGMPAGLSKVDNIANVIFRHKRPSARTLRRIWLEANPLEVVPRLPNGRYYDMHHIKPLWQGGTNTADNLIPMHPDAHRRLHIDNGDFSSRARMNRISTTGRKPSGICG